MLTCGGFCCKIDGVEVAMRRKICCLFSDVIPYRMGERKQMSKVTKAINRKTAKNKAQKMLKLLRSAAKEDGREAEKNAYEEVCKEKISVSVKSGVVTIQQLNRWNEIIKKYELTDYYQIPPELL